MIRPTVGTLLPSILCLFKDAKSALAPALSPLFSCYHSNRIRIFARHLWTTQLTRRNYCVHSFITEIYIAPLQGCYSEALPTLARLKRIVFRLEWNVSHKLDHFHLGLCSYLRTPFYSSV